MRAWRAASVLLAQRRERETNSNHAPDHSTTHRRRQFALLPPRFFFDVCPLLPRRCRSSRYQRQLWDARVGELQSAQALRVDAQVDAVFRRRALGERRLQETKLLAIFARLRQQRAQAESAAGAANEKRAAAGAQQLVVATKARGLTSLRARVFVCVCVSRPAQLVCASLHV